MICVHFLINKLNIEHIIALGGKKSNEKLGKNRKRGIELFTGRHFWNRKCRKKTWWQQEFAVFKCEATANSVTGHVCVNSNESIEKCMGGGNGKILPPPYCSICTSNPSPRSIFA